MARKDTSWVECSKVKFDCRMEVIHKVFHRLELFGSAQKDQEDIVCESPPDVDGPNEGLLDSFFVATHERLAYGVGVWCFHGCTNELEKMPVHE